MTDTQAVIEATFRKESGRIIATLIRVLGDFDSAEEAMQDALIAALDRWPLQGVPQNPGAWITTAARRKAVDRYRRERIREDKYRVVASETPQSPIESDKMFEESAIRDDRLRLIFTCCHPALGLEAQVALTLRTLGGLTTHEIARAFLIPETTLAQRLVRAKRRIKAENIPYRVPPDHLLLAERLSAVHAVLYLVFNEGYDASVGDSLIRRQLSDEAIRLARILAELMPTEPETHGLLALMLFHDSRREARVSAVGELLTLEEQDRSLWDHKQVEEASAILLRALSEHSAGPYQVQAAIAAVHSEAESAESTDWAEICGLYETLEQMLPTSVVRLNGAVAIAMGRGFEEGLHKIDRLGVSGELDEYHYFHSARANLLRRMGRVTEAISAYDSALTLVSNELERAFLERQRTKLHESRI